jgi:SNF2 family DNA or RNA helicase
MSNLKTNLLNHQLEAFEKLKKWKVFALFMDMGTGKTRTSLEFINLYLNENKIDKVLWFCPLSVKKNLELDIVKHSELLDKIYICGLETLSQSDLTYIKLYQYFISSNDLKLPPDIKPYKELSDQIGRAHV